MTAEQKDELLHKKERFDALPDSEKEHLRELHAKIEATPYPRQLHQTLSRYNAWLKTLSSAERAELLGLECDERIAKIKDILQRQESLRFREFAGNLPEQDREAIYGWLEEFVDKHEEELNKLAEKSPWSQFRSHSSDDPKRRQRSLMFTLLRRDAEEGVTPTREDFAALLPKLSEQTRHELDRTPTDRKAEAVRELVRAALFSKFMPQVSEDDLRTYFAKLDSRERERLETLDRDEMPPRIDPHVPHQPIPPRWAARLRPPAGRRRRLWSAPGGGFGPRGNGPPRGGDGPPRGGDGERRGPSGEKGRPGSGRNDGSARPKPPPPVESDPGD